MERGGGGGGGSEEEEEEEEMELRRCYMFFRDEQMEKVPLLVFSFSISKIIHTLSSFQEAH